MLELALAVACLLAVSALCSGTEAALFSVPLVRARSLAESRLPAPVALLRVREAMGRPIASIVVLNNMANIVGSIVVGTIATRVLGSEWLGVFSGALTFAVIICAEIIPKTLGERYAESIGLRVARPVLVLTLLMTPLVWLIERITAPLVRGQSTATTNEGEIQLLARIGKQEGVLAAWEAQIVQRAFKLNDQRAADVMTPRVALTRLDANDRLADVKEDILGSQHSRIVVCGENVDDVQGIVLKYDLLAGLLGDGEQSRVGDYVRHVSFVPHTARCDALLEHFLKTREHLVVVVDEFGGIEGVVTLEDVLEMVTGEIVDETDRVVDMRRAARASGTSRGRR